MQIVVLGMHRSGTSAIARLINLMGAYVGPSHFIGKPADDNQKGFWERADVKALNDEILAASDCSWSKVAGFDLQTISPEARRSFDEQAQQIIFEMDTQRPWVMKDPRLCLTLPIWEPLLEVPVYVFVTRSPIEIARSLYRRNGFSVLQGIALWEQYVLHGIAATRQRPPYFVSYNQLIEEPIGTVKSLYASLLDADVQGLRLPTESEVKAFIDSKLQHERAAQPSDLQSLLSPSQIDLAKALRNGEISHWDTLPKLSDMAQSVLSDWNKFQQLEEYKTASDVKHDQLAEQYEGLLQGKIQAESASEELQTRLQQTEQQLNQSLQQLQSRLEQAEHDKTSTEQQLNQSLQELQSRLEQAEHDKTSTEQQLNQSLQELQSQLQQTEQDKADFFKRTVQTVEAHIAQSDQRWGKLIKQLDEARVARQQNELSEHEFSVFNAQITQQKKSLEQQKALIQQLNTMLDSGLSAMAASFASWRWKIGNMLVRCAELLLFRWHAPLAKNHIEALQHQYRIVQGQVRACLAEISAPDQVPASEQKIGKKPPSLVTVPENSGLPDIILFPVIDWHFRIQRPQHLAIQLGALGHRVFYITTQVALNAKAAGFNLLESPSPNVFLVQLHSALSQAYNIYKEKMGGAYRDDLLQSLQILTEIYTVRTPIALVNLPFWRPLAEAIPGAKMVYDCMDYHAGFSTNTKAMLEEEDLLQKNADVVITTSEWLSGHVKDNGRDNFVIRNGADVEYFARRPAVVHRISERPVVGYIGAISDWFDLALVIKAAQHFSEWDFVLVGSTFGCPIEQADKIENIRFLGEVKYAEVPSYLYGFDVCIIPFKLTKLILATNPVKVYEYLNAGKPVVSVALPELKAMKDLVYLADDYESFISLLEQAMEQRNDASKITQRKAWASQQDWAKRALALQQVMLEQYPKVSVIVLTYNNLNYTKACLTSLGKFSDYPNWELIIVDNASSDESPGYLQQFAEDKPHVKVILNHNNLGFAGGNNVGLKAATGEYLVILNNDTYVTQGWLHGLVRHLQKDPTIGLIGPVTNNIGNEAKIKIEYNNMDEMAARAKQYTANHCFSLSTMSTLGFFCVAMSRAVYDAVGLLDEQFELGFFEDDDYCRRVQQAGYKIVLAEDVFVHHHLSASFNAIGQEKKMQVFEKNKKRYEEKWGKWRPHTYR